MQGTRVRALVQEDPTCRGATKPVRHNYWPCALEPVSHNYWACALEPVSDNYWARMHRIRAPQQEKPPQWEARAPQGRVALLAATRESPHAAAKTQMQPKLNKNK